MRASRCEPLWPVSRHQGASVLTWRCRLTPARRCRRAGHVFATRCIGAGREDFSEEAQSTPRTRASATSAWTRAAGALCNDSNSLPRPRSNRVLRLRRRLALWLSCMWELRVFVSAGAVGVPRLDLRVLSDFYLQIIALAAIVCCSTHARVTMHGSVCAICRAARMWMSS